MTRRRARAREVACLAAVAWCLPAPTVARDGDGDRGAAQARLETVTVTARRRPEAQQRTPVSLVALTGPQLEARALTHLRELARHVPNLTFAASQNVGEAAANVFVRGIGQEDFIAGSEPGVAFYVDGVYVSRATGLLTGLLDVERLEVLRGPQGTLFGKNAVGGAIQLLTAAPAPVATWRATLGGGSDGRREARGLLNVPVTERAWLRVAMAAARRDGYVRRLRPTDAVLASFPFDGSAEGDEATEAARAQLRWQPVDDWTVDLALDGTRRRTAQGAIHVDEINPRAGVLPTINSLIAAGRLPGPRIDGAQVTADLLETRAGGRNFIDQDVRGAAVTASRADAAGTWKLIAAWRDLRSAVRTDLDGTALDILSNEFREAHVQHSAELQWNGLIRGAAVTAGLFALRERSFTPPVAGATQGEVLYACGCVDGALPAGVTARRWLDADSLAGYAQATLPLAPRLAATLGLRQSAERKSIVGEILALDARLQPTSRVTAAAARDGEWSSFTYRAGLEWQAAEDLMVYGSAARGFKSGGFNVRPVLNLPDLGLGPFAPETATTYELGMRSEWLEQRLRLNLTVFHTDYRDVQLRQQTVQDGVTTTLIGNAAQARIRGVELEAVLRPAPGWTLAAAWGHLDPRYLDVGSVPGIDRSSAFQRTPRNSATLSLDREWPLAAGWLLLHADVSYRDREQFQLTSSPYDQRAFALVGARLAYRPRDERWQVAVSASNLTDERFRTAGRYAGLNQLGVATSGVGLPRQLGVELTIQR